MPAKKFPKLGGKSAAAKPAPPAPAEKKIPPARPDADPTDPVTRAERRLDRIARAIKAGVPYTFPADEDDEDIAFD